MRAGFLNVNSLRAHIEQIRQFLTENPSYHLFGVAETWLGPTIPDDCVRVEGYKIIRRDRNTSGGGVALYVRDFYTVEVLAGSDTTGPGKQGVPEYISCSLRRCGSPPILAQVVYRPPHTPFTSNPDFLDDLNINCSEHSHKFIMGDLNADLLSQSSDAKFIRKLWDELSLRLVQHGATHHTSSSHTWIDVIAVDDNDRIIEARNLPAPFHNGHNIIDVLLSTHRQEEPPSQFAYREYKKIDINDLLPILEACDWGALDGSDACVDVETAVNGLGANLVGAMDLLAPTKIFRPKKGKLPWVDGEIAHLYKKRDATYRRYKRTDSDTLLAEFIRLRDLAELKTTEARTAYYSHQLQNALTSNNIWKELRNLNLLPKKREDLNGISPDVLNQHFASVSVSHQEDSSSCSEIISSASEEDGFRFRPITFSDLVLAISHFSSQAVGEDGIPQSIILKSLPVLGPKLVQLINSSLQSSTFPTLWKRAHVMPIKKCALPSSASDFRPIALLSFLSKVLEKIVHEQLMDFLLTNNVLDPRQAGFRPHHSTQTALLRLTEDIRTGMDKKHMTFLLLFDFSKAFDTLSHTRLLERLRRTGFTRGVLQWFNSYLTGREQIVTTKSAGSSSWLSTNRGVPQGSVLGPLLFCLYINDVRDVLSPERVNHFLYADDLQIYVQVPWEHLGEGLAVLEEAARAVSDWAESASLKLNTGKTKAIAIGSPYYISAFASTEYCHSGVRLGRQTIPFSDTVKSLGVILDTSLSWRPQIDALTKKLNMALYSLRFFRQYTTENLRRGLATALLFPHLDYCSIVLLDASRELNRRLQKLQNSCVRYVCGVKRDEHISPYRCRLGWLRTDTRRQYFMAVLLYKVLRMREPDYLQCLLSRYVSRLPCRGEVKELTVPRMRTEYGGRSFQVQGPRLWNSLPLSIRTLPSLASFKTAVWGHLQSLDV